VGPGFQRKKETADYLVAEFSTTMKQYLPPNTSAFDLEPTNWLRPIQTIRVLSTTLPRVFARLPTQLPNALLAKSSTTSALREYEDHSIFCYATTAMEVEIEKSAIVIPPNCSPSSTIGPLTTRVETVISMKGPRPQYKMEHQYEHAEASG
jgi:hypothetical protein